MTVQYGLNIIVCDDAHEAIVRGFNYREPDYKDIRITQVVVVKKGTQQGNPTVDLILKDATGQKYVVMVTGAMLRAIPCEPE